MPDHPSPTTKSSADSDDDLGAALLLRLAAMLTWRLVPAIRRIIPPATRVKIAPLLGRIEARLAAVTKRQFTQRSAALVNVRPLLQPCAFDGGPIVLVNDALASGGAERQVVNTLCGLQNRTDRQIHLLCLRLAESADHDFYRGVLAAFRGQIRNVIESAEARTRLRGFDPSGSWKRIGSTIDWMPLEIRQGILRFSGDFLDQKPAIVHTWQDATSIIAGYAARLVGVPRVIISARNMIPTNFIHYRPYMAHAYCELATCANVIMLNNSVAGANDYVRWLGLDRGRVGVLRNGVDFSIMIRPAPSVTSQFRRALGIPHGCIVIGSIFRFYPEKRPMLWMQSAAEVARRDKRVHFVIFGTGPMCKPAADFAAKHGFQDRMHLPGTAHDSALAMSLFDVFLMTSLFEGTPNVILEASALGIPVVTTDAGGIRETIEQGVTGQVVDADPPSIADCVLQIARNSNWRNHVAARGPEFVGERFGLQRMLDETLAVYGMQARQAAGG